MMLRVRPFIGGGLYKTIPTIRDLMNERYNLNSTAVLFIECGCGLLTTPSPSPYIILVGSLCLH